MYQPDPPNGEGLVEQFQDQVHREGAPRLSQGHMKETKTKEYHRVVDVTGLTVTRSNMLILHDRCQVTTLDLIFFLFISHVVILETHD